MSESPLQLFKFVSVSGKISEYLGQLNQLLKEPYLWSADPTKFNDPFEFKVSVDWSATDVELRKRFFIDMPNESEAAFLAWKNRLTPEFRWSVAMSTRRDFLARLGVPRGDLREGRTDRGIPLRRLFLALPDEG